MQMFLPSCFIISTTKVIVGAQICAKLEHLGVWALPLFDENGTQIYKMLSHHWTIRVKSFLNLH